MEYLFRETLDVTQQFMIFQQLVISVAIVACVYSTKSGFAIIFDKPTTAPFQFPAEYNAGLPISHLVTNVPFIKKVETKSYKNTQILHVTPFIIT
jgi:hypothetical protein